MRTPEFPVAIDPPLGVGEQVKFSNGSTERLWWTVKAASERFAVATAQAPFKPKGTLMYAIADYQRGLRGPCDWIGQGFGDGSFTTEQCGKLLAELESGETEVSTRNNVRLAVLERGTR